MNILRLEVENFKCFERNEWAFEPGLNVVFGPNEAGKSSIREALLLALFGNAATTSAEVREKVHWGDDGSFKVSIEMEESGRTWMLTRDFEAKENALRATSGETITNRTAIAEEVARLVGTASENLYCAVACVTHTNLAETDAGTEIGERLRSVCVGQDDAARKALEGLGKKIAELTRGIDRPANNPGEVARLRAEVADLEKDLAEAEAGLSRVSFSKASAAQAETELGAAQTEFKAIQGVLQAYERRHAVEEKLNDAKHRETELDRKIQRAAALEAKIAQTGGELARLGGGDALPDEDELAETCRRLRADERSLNDRRRRQAELGAQSQALRGPSKMLWALLSLGVLLIAGGSYAVSVRINAWPLVVVGAVLSGIALWRRQKLGVRVVSGRLAAVRAEIAELQREIESAMDERLRLALTKFSCKTPTDLLAVLDKRHKTQDEAAKASAELGGLLDDRTREEMERERRDWSAARRDATEELESPDLMAGVLSPLAYQKHSQRGADLQATISRLDEQRRDADAAARAIPTDPAEAARLAEQLEVKKHRLDATEHRLAVYRVAADHIGRAISDVLTDAKPSVESALSEYIERITAGRYNHATVEVTNKGLQVALDSPAKGGLAEPDELSRGTADQLYLAARLGLARYVFGDARPPLLFDDPFVTFDDERFHNALALLRDFAEEYQILLFTCHSEYGQLGFHEIKLQVES